MNQKQIFIHYRQFSQLRMRLKLYKFAKQHNFCFRDIIRKDFFFVTDTGLWQLYGFATPLKNKSERVAELADARKQ
jgi:hypothetical protein